ncbi:glycerophosphodiester phosphodiesterase family protein [Isachenkonia alkalipeptolytica]|uniref:GP-PDE domain-containing protein n=1 Tax=Isachenkonia alkalipeptolytica TaxID=2565777 RepID=A0AA44BD96_9CLOT|nr:hypothetical protein [Isachenkonia alkalipeptolytica]
MKEQILRSIKDYRHYWREFTAFGVFYLFISGYIFIPILSYVLHRVLLFTRGGVALNQGAFSLLLDIRGIIGLILLMGLATVFIMVEIGTLVAMTYPMEEKKGVSITDGLIRMFYSLRRILSFGLIPLALILLLLIPLIQIPVMPEISELIELPGILQDQITEGPIIGMLYYGFVALALYLLIRLIFTIHEIVLGKKTTLQSMKSSWELTKNASITTFIKLLVLNMGLLAITVVILPLVAGIPRMLGDEINVYLQNLFLSGAGLLGVLVSILVTPINIMVITKLYRKEKGIGSRYPVMSLEGKEFPGLAKFEYKFFRLMRRRKITVLILFVTMVFGSFGMGSAVQQGMVYAGRNVEVISHRGIVSGEFENSLSAVRGSLEAQVDAVGMDVQMTKDEVIVLNHDPTLKRTFGLPHNIRNTEYKELMEQEPILPRNFEAGDPYLPTLDEVLTLIDGQMTIHIDVKTFGESELYAEKIVKVVEENDMEEYAYIQSFDYDFLKKVKELNPEIKTAQILYFALGDIGSLEVDYLTVYKGMLSDELVQRTRRSEKGLFVWTVNTEESIQEVLQYDIDGIITDYPLRVQEIMGRRRD